MLSPQCRTRPPGTAQMTRSVNPENTENSPHAPRWVLTSMVLIVFAVTMSMSTFRTGHTPYKLGKRARYRANVRLRNQDAKTKAGV